MTLPARHLEWRVPARQKMTYTITLNPALDRTLFVGELALHGSTRIRREARYAGGKGIDVSRALAGMKVPSVAMGFVGGFDGKEFEGRLLNEGVACDFTPISGEIRTNVVIHDEASGRETALLAPGPKVEPFELVNLIERLEHLTDLTHLVVSGSLPPGVAPTVYRRIIGIGSDRKAVTLLDASGEALRQGIGAGPTIIKPNRAELSELAGHDLVEFGEVVDACRSLREHVDIVLASLGAEGIVMLESDHAWHALPPKVEVESTVGAGDCAVAGFLSGLIGNEPLPDCLRRAVAAGTAATLNDGTGLCRCEDIDRLLPDVRLEPVKL